MDRGDCLGQRDRNYFDLRTKRSHLLHRPTGIPKHPKQDRYEHSWRGASWQYNALCTQSGHLRPRSHFSRNFRTSSKCRRWEHSNQRRSSAGQQWRTHHGLDHRSRNRWLDQSKRRQHLHKRCGNGQQYGCASGWRQHRHHGGPIRDADQRRQRLGQQQRNWERRQHPNQRRESVRHDE